MRKISILAACLLAAIFLLLPHSKVESPGHKTVSKQPPKTVPATTRPAAAATPTVKTASTATRRIAAPPSPVVEVRPDQIVTADGSVYPLRVYKPAIAANDPMAAQWWNDSISIDPVWSRGTGSNPTLLAMIDTGFAMGHEEFSGRWRQNTGEIGSTSNENPSKLNCSDRNLMLNKACNLIDDDFDGVVDNETGATTRENPSLLNCTDRSLPLNKSCNLIDDDGNGYADDVTGWDFVSYDRSVQAGETNPNGTTTQHGTMTTGVAAATGNNSRGIAGVDWHTDILPLQAMNDDGYGNTLTISRAVRYAADRGADVISLSLGTDADDPYLRQNIDYAISKGTIVVASAGNDGCDCISYPARYDEVVAVGAFDDQKRKASFSSWGANLDISAPGVNINTASWSPGNQTSSYAQGVAGTSFSAPMVAGLLTLELSYQPGATASQLLAAITSQALGPWQKTPYDHDSFIGYGRIQADASLTMAVNNFSGP